MNENIKNMLAGKLHDSTDPELVVLCMKARRPFMWGKWEHDDDDGGTGNDRDQLARRRAADSTRMPAALPTSWEGVASR